jgi:predicted Zn-dependent protease
MTAMEPSSPSGLLEAVLSHVTAEHAEVSYEESREASTRFANNAITQNVSKRGANLTVKAAFGQRVGQASVTDFRPASLKECVAQAEAIARASEPDSEYLPPPGPQEYPEVNGYDARVAGCTPEERAAGVRRATAAAEAGGLKSAGSYATNTYRFARANTAGLYHEQSLTDARFVMTAMSDDSSGWTQSGGHRWADATPGESAEVAVRKALDARSPREIEAGAYTVVLEPAAVADFFIWLSFTMDAKSAHEGRSAFTGREGERVGAPAVTVYSQPDHPEIPVLAAGEDGLPLPRTVWIENGVLKTLNYSRFWAEKTGRRFTGRPGNLIMEGGDRSLDDLVASVERGVLVTRFWYIRFVDPMKLLLTGMTRDGLYWIEDGQVRHGLKNMRFNESPLGCLDRIGALSGLTRAGRSWGAYVPAMRLDGFRFTSGTAF